MHDEHVLSVSKKIEMKNDKRLSRIVFKMRRVIISDVFEKFRSNSLTNHGLCPSHYLSAPWLSWNVMLKMTKIEFELIPDPGMYILFEKGTRGGISDISNRYSKDNSKYLESFDP